jgi:hypothetical protein
MPHANAMTYRVFHEKRDTGYYVLIHIGDLVIEKGPYEIGEGYAYESGERPRREVLSASNEADHCIYFLEKLLEY